MAVEDKSIRIGRAADNEGSTSLQPAKNITEVNYGAPTWTDLSTPSEVKEDDKNKRKGTANIWQDKVPADADNDTSKTNYFNAREEEDSTGFSEYKATQKVNKGVGPSHINNTYNSGGGNIWAAISSHR